jgi:hypothetical protein
MRTHAHLQRLRSRDLTAYRRPRHGRSERQEVTAEDRITFMMPSPELKIPASPEVHFPMRYSEWERHRGRVKEMQNGMPYLQPVAWAMVGISSSAWLGLAPWMGAFGGLSQNARMEYAFVTPMMFIVGILGALVAAGFLYVDHGLSRRQSRSVQSVLDEMDSMYAPHRATTLSSN